MTRPERSDAGMQQLGGAAQISLNRALSTLSTLKTLKALSTLIFWGYITRKI